MAPKRKSRISADRQARSDSAELVVLSATATPAETAPSSPILAHASPPVLPTHTQLAIQDLLNADSVQTSAEDFLVALTAMERRQLPKDLSSSDLDPQKGARCCCFDASSKIPSWTAHLVCERCKMLHALLKVSSKSTSPVAVKILLGTACAVTDCIGEQRTQGQEAPPLPHELLKHVVDFALDDLRVAKDGTALAKLMHVSSSVRFRIIKEFAPVVWYEADNSPRDDSNPQDRLITCRHVLPYVWDLLDSWSEDATVKRHSDRSLALPSCSDLVTTRIGDQITSLKACVRVSHGALRVNRAHLVNTEDASGNASSTMEKRHGPDVTLCVSRVCETLANAFADLRMAPRFASPWQRAVIGTFEVPFTRTSVDVTLVWQSNGGSPEIPAITRVWRFTIFNGHC